MIKILYFCFKTIKINGSAVMFSYDYVIIKLSSYSLVLNVLEDIQNSQYSDIFFLNQENNYKNINNKSSFLNKHNSFQQSVII